MAAFHDSDSIVAEWPEAASIVSAQLQDLLDVAAEQCITYAPLAEGENVADVPDRYRLAQKLQAQALFRASQVQGDQDTEGMQGYTVTVRPMDWTVRNLLRPARGIPVLG
jgi:hypothetical protein